MYGLVNQAIEDLVRTNYSDQAWHDVQLAAGVENLVFVNEHSYSDDLTFKLIHAACEVFMQSPEILLRLFGRHWIMYTGREGWHEFFDVSCTGVISFLEQLDNMHEKVLAAMPEASPPKIELIETPDGYELVYISERVGLALFFQGIVEGLAEFYDEPWVVDQIQTQSEDGTDRFRLRLLSSVLKNPPKKDAA